MEEDKRSKDERSMQQESRRHKPEFQTSTADDGYHEYFKSISQDLRDDTPKKSKDPKLKESQSMRQEFSLNFRSNPGLNSNSLDSESEISVDDPDLQMLPDQIDYTKVEIKFEDALVEEEDEGQSEQPLNLFQKYQELNKANNEVNKEEQNEDDDNNLGSLFDDENSNDQFGDGSMMNLLSEL